MRSMVAFSPVEPPIDGPMPGVALAGCPFRERDGDGQRQERGQSRQPLVLLVHLPGGPVDAGSRTAMSSPSR